MILEKYEIVKEGYFIFALSLTETRNIISGRSIAVKPV